MARGEGSISGCARIKVPLIRAYVSQVGAILKSREQRRDFVTLEVNAVENKYVSVSSFFLRECTKCQVLWCDRARSMNSHPNADRMVERLGASE